MAEKVKVVLVAVLKNWRDFQILLRENWYHIPANKLPKKDFDYLAFYQPLSFGKAAKRIGYYGKVKKIETKKRIELFPKAQKHPSSQKMYSKITIKKLVKLKYPIKNIVPRRIVFGFTSLSKLLHSRDILELYGIADTEQMIAKKLEKNCIKFKSQFYVIISNKKRFRLDFAIFCRKGKIAIECDNDKAHKMKQQKIKDQEKDRILRSRNWKVIRLRENEILFKIDKCLDKIKKAISSFNSQ
ncbi:MAG: DUF559 domain-containing protein [Patescibacteria group bacterium]|nr:DUF559 domain-containing protein [Patescibacteria group bacterium]